jgi:hypothetical protein
VAAPEAASSPAASSAEALDADEIAARAALLRSAGTTSTTLVNTNWAGVPKPVRPASISDASGQTASAAIAPQSYHGADDGTLTASGAAGINFTNPPHSSPYGIVATHDIFQPQTQLQLPLPPTQYSNWLNAPTTRGVAWTCLEIGTNYYRPGVANSKTTASIYVHDACGGPGWTTNLDATFFKNYVTPATTSRPAHYQLAILNVTSPPSASAQRALPMSPAGWHPAAQWNAEFFNVSKKRWDIVYLIYGKYAASGWTMYETHYQANYGQSVSCPHGLPTIGARNIATVTSASTSQLFTSADSTLYVPLPGETSFGSFGACFNPGAGPDGKTSPASNAFNLISPNNAWSVSNPH